MPFTCKQYKAVLLQVQGNYLTKKERSMWAVHRVSCSGALMAHRDPLTEAVTGTSLQWEPPPTATSIEKPTLNSTQLKETGLSLNAHGQQVGGSPR